MALSVDCFKGFDLKPSTVYKTKVFHDEFIVETDENGKICNTWVKPADSCAFQDRDQPEEHFVKGFFKDNDGSYCNDFTYMSETYDPSGETFDFADNVLKMAKLFGCDKARQILKLESCGEKDWENDEDGFVECDVTLVPKRTREEEEQEEQRELQAPPRMRKQRKVEK